MVIIDNRTETGITRARIAEKFRSLYEPAAAVVGSFIFNYRVLNVRRTFAVTFGILILRVTSHAVIIVIDTNFIGGRGVAKRALCQNLLDRSWRSSSPISLQIIRPFRELKNKKR